MTKENKKPEKEREGLSTIWVILITAAVTAFLLTVVFTISIVPSESMEPTIETGHVILGWQLPYKLGTGTPKRGDIVTFKRSGDDDLYVKRVIGLPGDKIEIKDGITYINGEEYPEEYLPTSPYSCEDMTFEVPDGCYFMMGDNRNSSFDCRYWSEHYIAKENIVAKVIWIQP